MLVFSLPASAWRVCGFCVSREAVGSLVAGGDVDPEDLDHACRLADFDDSTIGISHVAPQLNAVVAENRGPLHESVGNLQQMTVEMSERVSELGASLQATLTYLQAAILWCWSHPVYQCSRMN